MSFHFLSNQLRLALRLASFSHTFGTWRSPSKEMCEISSISPLIEYSLSCILCGIIIPQYLTPSIFIFYEFTYTTLSESLDAGILDVWILDSAARNLDRLHLPITIVNINKIKGPLKIRGPRTKTKGSKYPSGKAQSTTRGRRQTNSCRTTPCRTNRDGRRARRRAATRTALGERPRRNTERVTQ